MGYAFKRHSWDLHAENQSEACWNIGTSQACPAPEHVWVLIQSQLRSYRQHYFVFFPSEEVQRSYSQVSTCMGKMPTHLWSFKWMVRGWGGCWGRWMMAGVVSEKGVVRTGASRNATLFCLFWRIKLLILLAGCVPSFLLSLAVEDGLNYWVFCSFKDQLKKKQIPLNSTFSSSMLPHCPQNIFCVFRQFQFFPLKKKFSPFSSSPWSTNHQGHN